jgi:cytochrome c/nitrate/TMAO reductase-like tetraheme cytochrome c subunit
MASIRRSTLLLLLAGAVIGVAGFAVSNRLVVYAGTNRFCATACHTMQAADEAYRRGIHAANAAGVPATCSDCHIPFESARNKGALQWVQLVAFKAKVGISDVIGEWRGVIATPQRWEAERARLNQEVHAFVRRTDSSTCRGCHDLQAFRKGTMYQLVHGDDISAKAVDCLDCHSGMAHVYDHPPKGAPPAKPSPAMPAVAAAITGPGPVASLVQEGRRIFEDTPGDAASAPYVGKGVKRSCGTCHRKGGTDLDALPLLGAAAAYPAAVDGRTMTLDERIGECFAQHLAGTVPPPGSPVVRALGAYVASLSQGRRMAMSADGAGPRGLRPLPGDSSFWSAKDVAKGKALYASMCSSCHGADGSGGAGPAVWGAKAFAAGSAMARAPKLAAYLSSAMAGYVGSLGREQARDIAEYVDAQPRPGFTPPAEAPR